jgi:hypothetical protein
VYVPLAARAWSSTCTFSMPLRNRWKPRAGRLTTRSLFCFEGEPFAAEVLFLVGAIAVGRDVDCLVDGVGTIANRRRGADLYGYLAGSQGKCAKQIKVNKPNRYNSPGRASGNANASKGERVFLEIKRRVEREYARKLVLPRRVKQNVANVLSVCCHVQCQL